MEEALLKEGGGAAELPSRMLFETRAGGVVATRLLLRALCGGDFKDSHFCPRSGTMACWLISLAPTAEKTPCSKFRGVLPFRSRGCIGTIPSCPFWRTKTAVTFR